MVTAVVVIADPPALSLSITATDVTCNGICDASTTVIGVGGTLPYTSPWDDPLGQTHAIATGLCLGAFNITITDVTGCIIVDAQAITEPASIVLTETHSDANCGQADGIATVSVAGGTPPYNVIWSNGSTDKYLSKLCDGTYFVTVTDANGCIVVGNNVVITN